MIHKYGDGKAFASGKPLEPKASIFESGGDGGGNNEGTDRAASEEGNGVTIDKVDHTAAGGSTCKTADTDNFPTL